MPGWFINGPTMVLKSIGVALERFGAVCLEAVMERILAGRAIIDHVQIGFLKSATTLEKYCFAFPDITFRCRSGSRAFSMV